MFIKHVIILTIWSTQLYTQHTSTHLSKKFSDFHPRSPRAYVFFAFLTGRSNTVKISIAGLVLWSRKLTCMTRTVWLPGQCNSSSGDRFSRTVCVCRRSIALRRSITETARNSVRTCGYSLVQRNRSEVNRRNTLIINDFGPLMTTSTIRWKK